MSADTSWLIAVAIMYVCAPLIALALLAERDQRDYEDE